MTLLKNNMTGFMWGLALFFYLLFLAAIYAMPVETQGGLFLSPRLRVAILLGGLAALAQIIYLSLRIENVRQI